MLIDKFSADLAAFSLHPNNIIADSKIHRFSASGDKRDDAGWYILTIEGEIAFGGFGDHRRNLKEGWSSLKGKQSNAADLQKMAEAQKKAKSLAARDEKVRNEDCRRKAKFIWEKAIEGNNEYVDRKKIKPYSAKLYKGLMVIPIYNDGDLQSVQMISADGKKKFLSGTKKQGSYLQLGEIVDKIILCEGWATGCSLHEATGMAVIVAWDAYNLVPVAKMFKKLYPDAKMIIAGDNDYGKAENVGAKYAKLAAEAVGDAQVYLPPACIEQPERLSIDWNDLGIDSIREIFFPPAYDFPQEEIVEYDAPFRILGHDKGTYYYLPYADNQVVELTASSHTPANLLRLADMAYWAKYGDIYGSRKSLAVAQNDLIRQSTLKGVFRVSDRLRGIGAWLDDDRHILHCGDKVYVNGECFRPSDVSSKFIYEECPAITTLHPKPLGNKESYELRKICEMLNWENPLSGSLLAGWCVAAPVCAMLPWRPHIWITGESQAGKTTVLTDVVKVMVMPMALMLVGGTTEAAIRQRLGHDARPIIYDEAEAESKKDVGIMEGVMNLARISASGGEVNKGTSSGHGMTFHARSAFCYSGINPSLKQKADESRTSVLHLKRDNSINRIERYKEWQTIRSKTITEEYSSRMLARTVANLSTLIENCKTFTSAADIVFNDRRAADQIGVMLAGLYLLGTTGKITLEKAKQWIEQHEWTQHTAATESSDHERLIEFISTKTLRITIGNNSRDVAIGELINCAAGLGGIAPSGEADRELRRIGISVKNNKVYVANKSSNLSRLLEGQPWASNWKRVLLNIKNSANESPLYFFPGVTSRAVSIPLEIFSKDDYEPAIEF